MNFLKFRRYQWIGFSSLIISATLVILSLSSFTVASGITNSKFVTEDGLEVLDVLENEKVSFLSFVPSIAIHTIIQIQIHQQTLHLNYLHFRHSPDIGRLENLSLSSMTLYYGGE